VANERQRIRLGVNRHSLRITSESDLTCHTYRLHYSYNKQH